MCKPEKATLFSGWQISVIEYEDQYAEQLKDLLVELQEHISSLDSRGVIILKPNYREDYFNYILSEVKKHDGKIFLTTINTDVIIGAIVCKIFQGGEEADITSNCPRIGFVSDLILTKEYRGYRLGESLLERASQYFKEKDCVYMQLEVFEPNASAYMLYNRLGFKTLSRYMHKDLRIDEEEEHYNEYMNFDYEKELAAYRSMDYDKLFHETLSSFIEDQGFRLEYNQEKERIYVMNDSMPFCDETRAVLSIIRRNGSIYLSDDRNAYDYLLDTPYYGEKRAKSALEKIVQNTSIIISDKNELLVELDCVGMTVPRFYQLYWILQKVIPEKYRMWAP